MTNEKLMQVIALYRKMFEEDGYKKEKCSPTRSPFGVKDKYRHCHAMLDEMEQFVADGQIEKAMRWLGFIQGVLWGPYTLEELMNHNRPD